MKTIRQSRFYRISLNVFFLITVLVLMFIVGKTTGDGKCLYLRAAVSNDKESTSIQNNLKELENIYQLVKDSFVRETNKDQLFENAIKGMVGGLDPYSEYMNVEEYNEFAVSTKGEFGGIGVEISVEEGFITVISPLEDTPAFRAGILPGDKILEINGESTEGISTSECAKRVRGKPGISVTLKVLHKNDDTPVDITLVREVIKLKSVKDVKIIDLPDGKAGKKAQIGYIRVTAFQEDTARLFDEALKKLQGQFTLGGLIIDLRFNSGGIMEASIRMVNRFIESGTILSLKGRRINEEIKADPSEAIITSTPLVILVNGGSASASEILSGALQDHHRATLIGSHTYGKGSVQSIFTIKDSSGKNIRGAVKLTTARYHTPSGRCLERDKDKKDYGLEPDIVVEMSPKEEARLIKSRLKSTQNVPADDSDDELPVFVDVQLERAIKFLKEGK